MRSRFYIRAVRRCVSSRSPWCSQNVPTHMETRLDTRRSASSMRSPNSEQTTDTRLQELFKLYGRIYIITNKGRKIRQTQNAFGLHRIRPNPGEGSGWCNQRTGGSIPASSGPHVSVTSGPMLTPGCLCMTALV